MPRPERAAINRFFCRVARRVWFFSTNQFCIRSQHSSMATLQAQKTVESQKLALNDQEMERSTAAQNRGRLAAAQKQLKALQWEHEVRAGPSATCRNLAGFAFLLIFQDFAGSWERATWQCVIPHRGKHCERYGDSGWVPVLVKLSGLCRCCSRGMSN